ncbi:MAG: CBS domain-containing protein [Gammaproteobacteria bacterium]|nr:CBS domain-containing protein [Gammaproteobacteria bacterium]MBA3731726.1 CBS domain-containing protein [Gammaproteobacteria bacterium]
MSQSFHPLPTQALATDTVVFRYRQGLPVSVSMDATALDVMTDLLRVKVFTVAPETPIDDALQKMIHAEVRLLIVTGYADSVLGVITATDIMGERPIAISSAERVPHSAIRVEQVMTARDEIGALRMKDVERASVGDIVATLRGAGRQHAIVLDQDDRGKAILRGIFSTTQIAKLLGVALEADGKAQSFAELERALQA